MTDTTGYANFDIGRVIKRAFSVLSADMAPFIIAWLVVYVAAPVIFVTLIGVAGLKTESFSRVAISAPFVVLFGVVALILSSATTKAAVASLTGEDVSFGANISGATRRFWGLLGMAIVSGLMIGLGFIFLIVPGLILMTLFAVSQPVLLVEGRGPIDSLGRSRELTRGSRWSIVALALLYIVLMIALSIPAMIGAVVASGVGGGRGTPVGMVVNVIGSVIQIFGNLVGVAGIAAIYVELRNMKGGFADKTAELFL